MKGVGVDLHAKAVALREKLLLSGSETASRGPMVQFFRVESEPDVATRVFDPVVVVSAQLGDDQ
jgi:hypothetical protein